MTYHCGLGVRLGDRPPTIVCDVPECVARIVIDGDPPRWFLARKAKPGWRLQREEMPDGRVVRVDHCPAHADVPMPCVTPSGPVTQPQGEKT